MRKQGYPWIQQVYQLLLLVFQPLVYALLYYSSLNSRKFRQDWYLRKAIGLESIPSGGILVHVAALGELHAVLPLMDVFRRHHPKLPIVYSTMNSDAKERLDQLSSSKTHTYACFLPYDRTSYVARFLDQLAPTAIALVEKELWPTLILEAHRRDLPILLLNGQLTASALKKYRRLFSLPWSPLRTWFQFPMHKLTHICAQTSADAERFIALGIPQKRITVCGTLKASTRLIASNRQKLLLLKKQLNPEGKRFIWIAGSTYAPEEKIILSAHKALLHHRPESLLILAPRELNRITSLKKQLKREGWKFACLSEANNTMNCTNLLLIDTIGDLAWLYGLATHAFIGGSLLNKGGHNLLEAAWWKLVLGMGPYRDKVEHLAKPFERLQLLNTLTDSSSLLNWLCSNLTAEQNKEYEALIETLDTSAEGIAAHLEKLCMLAVRKPCLVCKLGYA